MQKIKLALPFLLSFCFSGFFGWFTKSEPKVEAPKEQPSAEDQKPQDVKVTEGVEQFITRLSKQDTAVMNDAKVKKALSGLLGYLLALKNDKGASHIAVAKPLIESLTAFLKNQDQELLTSADIQAAIQAHLKEIKTIAPKSQTSDVPPAGSPTQPVVIPGAPNPAVKQQTIPQRLLNTQPTTPIQAVGARNPGVKQETLQAPQTTVQKPASTALAKQASNSAFGKNLIQTNGTTSKSSSNTSQSTIPQAPVLNGKPPALSSSTAAKKSTNSTATSGLQNNIAQSNVIKRL